MNDPYQRVQMLAGTGRHDLAERDLRAMLAEEPRDATAHSLLALVMMSDERRWADATAEAKMAVGIEPDASLSHYALALCLVTRNHYAEAEDAAREALRLDPYDADAYAVLSKSYLGRENYQAAIDAAEQGLSVDPEHSECGNLRSILLERLGRGDEAIESATRNLARDPDSSHAHAALGWTQLNNGKYKEAQVAFREALRLNPHDEMARQGLIQAMNNRSFLFRGVHTFYVWMSRLNSKAAFGLIFGAWILMQVLSRVADNVPALGPFILPLLIVYVLFVVLTWIANPLFNTFLRFHPFGRHLLDRTQTWSSNLIAPSLALAVVGLIVGTVVDSFILGLLAAAFWIGAAIMVAATFTMPTPQRRLLVGGASVLVLMVPVVGIVRTILGGQLDLMLDSFQAYGYALLAVQIGSSIVANQPIRR
jgi:tetratricopeptide (TPR) repeat protein